MSIRPFNVGKNFLVKTQFTRPPHKRFNIESRQVKNMSEDDDYKIGYGRPPKHSQYKKGQSGYIQGRPKGRKSLRTIIQEEMRRTIAVKINGERLKVSRMHAFVLGEINRGLAGNGPAAKRLWEFVLLNFHLDEKKNEVEPSTHDSDNALQKITAKLDLMGERMIANKDTKVKSDCGSAMKSDEPKES